MFGFLLIFSLVEMSEIKCCIKNNFCNCRHMRLLGKGCQTCCAILFKILLKNAENWVLYNAVKTDQRMGIFRLHFSFFLTLLDDHLARSASCLLGVRVEFRLKLFTLLKMFKPSLGWRGLELLKRKKL